MTVGGKEYSSRACLITACELEPSNSEYLVSLGSSMFNDGEVTIHATKHTKLSCFTLGLKTSPTNPEIWHLVGSALINVREGAVTMCGTNYDWRACWIKSQALKKSPQ